MSNSKNKLIPFLCLLPATLILSIFVIIPIGYSFYLSFFNWNLIAPTKNFVGLQNYYSLFTDPINRKVMVNTIFYVILLVILNFLFPYLISLIVKYFIKKMQGAYKIIFFIPSLFSLVVGAMVFSWVLNPVSGPMAFILRKLGMTLPNCSSCFMFDNELESVWVQFYSVVDGPRFYPTEYYRCSKSRQYSAVAVDLEYYFAFK